MRKLALAIVASLIVVSGLFLATPRAAKAVCTIGLGCNCPQAAKGPFNDGLYYGLARTGLGSGTLTYELNADFFADKYQQGYCDIVTWVTWVDNNGDELNNTLATRTRSSRKARCPSGTTTSTACFSRTRTTNRAAPSSPTTTAPRQSSPPPKASG